MFHRLKKHKFSVLLWFFIGAYIIYFSYFTILRMRTLYASYFDLGIMHQTVFNTYRSITEKDLGRFLELTNPFGPDQIRRMDIHNDILLIFLVPFYFLYSGPETLLIIQTVVLAFGAVAVFKITQKVLIKAKNKDLLALIFAVSYLLYPPLERANIFDFHAVSLATTFLLFMFYFWLQKNNRLSFIFLLLSIFSKEQVALTTLFFGIYAFLITRKQNKNIFRLTYPFLIITLSIIWFILSVSVIIPYFRGTRHFALSYYGDFGESPIGVIIGMIHNPYSILKYIFHIDTLRYGIFLLGPLGFISLLSPIQLLISSPEFAINLLSNSWNMRNIIYHYTAVIQPFVFISAIYGASWLLNKVNGVKKRFLMLGAGILLFCLVFAYFKGPLPFSREKEIHPFKYPQAEAKETLFWAKTLKNERLKISSTGQLSPFFTSRRYFYTFSDRYQLADYVVIRLNEIYNYPEKNELIPIYEQLQKNTNFKRIYNGDNFEVYKKIK